MLLLTFDLLSGRLAETAGLCSESRIEVGSAEPIFLHVHWKVASNADSKSAIQAVARAQHNVAWEFRMLDWQTKRVTVEEAKQLREFMMTFATNGPTSDFGSDILLAIDNSLYARPHRISTSFGTR